MERMKGRRRESLLISIYALALGIAISVTMTIHFQTVWSSPDHNYLMVGLPTMLRGIGIAIPVFFAVWFLNEGVRRISFHETPDGKRRMSGRKFFLLCWGILVLCSLPYLLTYLPGGVVGDGAETLEYALQTNSINGRWGVTQIMAFRLFLALGRVISPDVNVGIFLYTVCSLLLYTAACAAVIATLRKKGVPTALLIIFLFIYAYVGHYASFGMALWKDGLYSAGIIAFSLLLWQEPEEGKPRKRWMAGTGAVTLFLCFWRNFVSYGLLTAGIVLLLVRRKQRKALAILLILISLLSIVIQGPVYRAAGVEEGRISEALSITIQQVAAVLYSGETVTEEQGEILYGMLPRETWKSEYSPGISDTVKHKINDSFLRAHLGGFLKVWVQLMIRNPGIYLKAFLIETPGYWQPYGSYKGAYYDWFLGVQDIYGRGYRQKDLLFDRTGYTMRYGLEDRMPFIPSGTMVWIMLLSLTLALCRKNRNGVKILLPCLLCWIAVMCSAPIAYSYRYIEMLAMGFPLFVCVPLIREEAGEGTVSEIIQRAGNGKTAVRITAGLAAAVMILVMITGTVQVYGFQNDRIEIRLTGSRDNTEYFIREGISVPEKTFRWTVGDELKAVFPVEKDGETLGTVIHVDGILGKKQGYTVLDLKGNEIARGEIRDAGEIRFDLRTEGKEAGFILRLPDAAVISEVLKHSTDTRKAAMRISRI